MRRISLFLSIGFLYGWLHWLLRSKALAPPSVCVAHRGAAGLAPENTLAAIQEGIEQGAQFIEIDIRRSADGVLVLMHDNDVQRTTTGAGKVGELTWQQFQALRVSAQPTRSPGEPIARLEDALALTLPAQVTLVIEVKAPQLYPRLAEDLLGILDQAGARNQVMVICFDKDWLLNFHQLAPDVQIGQLALWAGQGLPPPISHVIDLWWPTVLFDPTLLRRMHRKNCQVWVWTVDAPLLMRLLCWLGVDGVTTNRPDLWRTRQKH